MKDVRQSSVWKGEKSRACSGKVGGGGLGGRKGKTRGLREQEGKRDRTKLPSLFCTGMSGTSPPWGQTCLPFFHYPPWKVISGRLFHVESLQIHPPSRQNEVLLSIPEGRKGLLSRHLRTSGSPHYGKLRRAAQEHSKTGAENRHAQHITGTKPCHQGKGWKTSPGAIWLPP